jgi:hypothetical protein
MHRERGVPRHVHRVEKEEGWGTTAPAPDPLLTAQVSNLIVEYPTPLCWLGEEDRSMALTHPQSLAWSLLRLCQAHCPPATRLHFTLAEQAPYACF